MGNLEIGGLQNQDVKIAGSVERHIQRTGFWVIRRYENSTVYHQPCSQMSQAFGYDVTCKACWEDSPGCQAKNGKFNMAELGQVPNFSQNNRQCNHISFLSPACTMLPWFLTKKASFCRAIVWDSILLIWDFLQFIEKFARPYLWFQVSSTHSHQIYSANWPGEELRVVYYTNIYIPGDWLKIADYLSLLLSACKC